MIENKHKNKQIAVIIIFFTHKIWSDLAWSELIGWLHGQMGHIFLLYHLSLVLPRSHHDPQRLLLLQPSLWVLAQRRYEQRKVWWMSLLAHIFFLPPLPCYVLQLLGNNSPFYWLWAQSCKFFGQKRQRPGRFPQASSELPSLPWVRCFSFSLGLKQPWTWSRACSSSSLSVKPASTAQTRQTTDRGAWRECLLQVIEIFLSLFCWGCLLAESASFQLSSQQPSARIYLLVICGHMSGKGRLENTWRIFASNKTRGLVT